MTSEPPSSSNQSPLPPRHRPTLGNLSQDTTEQDLWDLEDDVESPADTNTPESAGKPRSTARQLPAPRIREAEKSADSEKQLTPKSNGGEDQVRMNVTKSHPKRRPSNNKPISLKPESEFDELEDWEDVRLEPEIEDLPAEELTAAEPDTLLPEPAKQEDETEKSAESEEQVSVPSPVVDPEDDEFSPAPRQNTVPASLPRLGLSKIERIGLIALLVLLLGGGAGIFLTSIHRLPTESVKAEATDFPIQGEYVSITAATNYWRAPIKEGPDADTFRRGTELLPELDLAVSGGPAAIRVLFRSEDRTVVGDVVTRTINGASHLKIPATAGFDDPGMHAAYRTGESKPWTVEVHEARSADASGKDFKKLFEMNISTDRR